MSSAALNVEERFCMHAPDHAQDLVRDALRSMLAHPLLPGEFFGFHARQAGMGEKDDIESE